MRGYDRLLTLVIFSGQLSASKVYSNFNWRTSIMKLLQSSQFLLPPSQNDGPYPRIFLSQMIVLLPKSFCPKMNVEVLYDLLSDKNTFDTGLDIRGSKSNTLEIQSHHQQDFWHHNFRGCFKVVAIYYLFLASYSQLLAQSWAGLNLAKIRK